jgi:hypothetical protein
VLCFFLFFLPVIGKGVGACNEIGWNKLFLLLFVAQIGNKHYVISILLNLFYFKKKNNNNCVAVFSGGNEWLQGRK